MGRLSTETAQELRNTINEACADQVKGIPGATVVVVGKDGQELFAHSAGKNGAGSSEPLTLDNIFWIASCTKMLVGVACMQLVEQKKLSLDDANQVEDLAHELRTVRVLQRDGSLTEKKHGITLRMLLTHTGKNNTDHQRNKPTKDHRSRFWIQFLQ